jgi:hypothetical protein
MGVFLRIIGPLAEAIKGPSVYFDVIFFTVYLYDEDAIISDIVIIDFMSTKQCDSGYNSQ